MATQANSSTTKTAWYVDSGCTNHMAKDESLFISLHKPENTKVKLGNGKIVQATGRGTVLIQTVKGPKLIHDVLLIPVLDQNLLSEGQLVRKGYSLSFKDCCCVIFDGNGCEIVKIKMSNNSFPLKLESVKHSALVTKHESSSLWHRRLGHFNASSLRHLKAYEMVEDLPEIIYVDEVCSSCQLGKIHRKPFPTGNVFRASLKLELIHTDLCGPMNVSSLN